MIETLSSTTFVVDDRLPWPDEPSHPEKGNFDAGVLIDSGSRMPCSIRKISARGATLLTERKMAAGSPVAVELGNGQRPAGTVDWADRHELGVRFNESVDVLALINRKLVSQPVERRSMPRVEVRHAIHLQCAGMLAPATMRNISARGIQIEGKGLPPAGTFISLFVEGLNIPGGEVVWSRGNLAGIELFEELSWTSIVPWVRDVMRKGAN
jgi:PilZ domain-containing protein